MFFQKLITLLATCQALNITMEQGEDGKITLSVSMKYKDDKAKLPPIVMSGTAEELDAGFAEAFGKVEANLGIFTNIDMFLEQAKSVAKDAKAKADPKKPAKEEKKEDEDSEGSEDDNKEGAEITNVGKSEKRKKSDDKAKSKETKPEVKIPDDIFNTVSLEQKPSTTEEKVVVEEEKANIVQPAPPVEPKSEPVVTPPIVPIVQTAPIQPVITAPAPGAAVVNTKAPAPVVPDDDIF